ncbi:MAG: hypothetical protein HY459_02375 [Parcubacteria group bacterium]|nr:hypothetical protein [Parcubacteria group bacterium]
MRRHYGVLWRSDHPAKPEIAGVIAQIAEHLGNGTKIVPAHYKIVHHYFRTPKLELVRSSPGALVLKLYVEHYIAYARIMTENPSAMQAKLDNIFPPLKMGGKRKGQKSFLRLPRDRTFIWHWWDGVKANGSYVPSPPVTFPLYMGARVQLPNREWMEPPLPPEWLKRLMLN